MHKCTSPISRQASSGKCTNPKAGLIIKVPLKDRHKSDPDVWQDEDYRPILDTQAQFIFTNN